MTNDIPDTPDDMPDATRRDDMSRDTGDNPDTVRHGPTPDTLLLLSQEQAARRAGVSVRTLQRAASRGDIERVTHDSRAMYRIVDIDAWRVARGEARPAMATAPTPATRPQHDSAWHGVASVIPTAPGADARDATIAALSAERDGLRDMLAFTKDQLELRREELDASHDRHARQIADLTATISAQADTIRAMQAAAIPPQVVESLPTGNAVERTETARGATDPRFVGDQTLKRPSRLARLRGWIPFP